MGERPCFGTCQAFDRNWGVGLGVTGLGVTGLGVTGLGVTGLGVTGLGVTGLGMCVFWESGRVEGSCNYEVLVRRSNFTHHKYSYTVWLVGGTFDGCNTICELKVLFLHQLDQHNTTLT
jgi:hypothetical protein